MLYYLSQFCNVCQGNDRITILFPNHPPKIINGVFKWAYKIEQFHQEGSNEEWRLEGRKGSFSRFGPVIQNIIALCFCAARKQTKTVLLINSSMEENINDAFFHAIFKFVTTTKTVLLINSSMEENINDAFFHAIIKFVITTKTLFQYLTRCPTL